MVVAVSGCEGRRLRRAAPEERGRCERGGGAVLYAAAVDCAIVDVMRPDPKMIICDPACGTGGFLLASYQFLSEIGGYELDREQKMKLASGTLYGIELVDGVARLCCMNMLLHGISADGADEVPIEVRDALGSQGGKNYELVMNQSAVRQEEQRDDCE